MKRIIAFLAFALVFCTAHADEARNDAIVGGIADCASTFIGIEGYKLTESNKIVSSIGSGVLLACGLKPLAIAYADRQVEPQRTYGLTFQSSLWMAMMGNNVTLLTATALHAAGIISSPLTGPAGLIVGGLAGLIVWERTKPERERAVELAHLCDVHKSLANDPNLDCHLLK